MGTTIGNMIGAGFQLGSNTNKTFFVRPVGTTYGTGDGLSYDNAFSGFTAINWTNIIDGDTLFVCGTHSQILTVGTSGVKIYGNYATSAGIINGNNLLYDCLQIVSKNDVTISDIKLMGATSSCLLISGTSLGVITNNIETTGSGNQGIQHLDTVSATHNNLYSHHNVDDGVSGHDDATIILNGGIIEYNAENINYVGSVDITVNDCIIRNATNKSLYPNSTGISVFNRCIIKGLNCMFENSGIVTFNNCLIDSPQVISLATITYNKCYLTGTSYLTASASGAKYTLNHCLIDKLTSTAHVIDSGGSYTSTIDVNYTIINTIPSGKYGVVRRANSVVTVRNCTLRSTAKAGNGLGGAGTGFVAYNTICTNLGIGAAQLAGTITLENCCLYDNTTPKSGTVTSNQEVTNNPNLVDVAAQNYAIGAGSSCIGTGETLTGFETGIESATWGNGTSEIPIVILKQQGASFDIGAYIH